MDAIDKRILRIVQKDASLPIREIATQVGLSQTACWKRLQRLDASGVIKRRIALLDPLKLGLGLTAFVSVQVGDHSDKAMLASPPKSPRWKKSWSAIAWRATSITACVSLCPMPRPSIFFTSV
jgi:DNA-binding Lrp family transcriptional regulator